MSMGLQGEVGCNITAETYLDHILGKGVLAHLVLILIGEEFHDFGTMITLQLNHLSHVRVLDDGAIACYGQLVQ